MSTYINLQVLPEHKALVQGWYNSFSARSPAAEAASERLEVIRAAIEEFNETSAADRSLGAALFKLGQAALEAAGALPPQSSTTHAPIADLEKAVEAADSDLYLNTLPTGKFRLGEEDELSVRIPYHFTGDGYAPDVKKANELAKVLKDSGLFSPEEVNGKVIGHLASFAAAGEEVVLKVAGQGQDVVAGLESEIWSEDPAVRALYALHVRTGAIVVRDNKDPQDVVRAKVPRGRTNAFFDALRRSRVVALAPAPAGGA